MPGLEQIGLRLLAAALLSGIIGYERELHGRAAGLRTTILVGVGSCLMMLTSLAMAEDGADPARIAAQVVSGIGFLGAGTIIRFRASVRGLTTAAGLWSVAGVGLAVGSGFYSAAFITTAIIFIVLFALSHLEGRIKRSVFHSLSVELTGGMDQLCKIRKIFTDVGGEMKDLEMTKKGQNRYLIDFQLRLYNQPGKEERISTMLLELPGVHSVHWNRE